MHGESIDEDSKAGVNDEAASESAQSEGGPPTDVTILTCRADKVLAKRWYPMPLVDLDAPDGKGGFKNKCRDYDKAGSFYVETRPVGNIRELHALLLLLQVKPRKCIIRGFPRAWVEISDGTKKGELYPRWSHDRKGEEAPFEERSGQPWICVDLDGVPLPPGMSAAERPDELREYLERTYLPPELRDVTHVFQWSSSAGMKSETISAHIWFYLDRPMGYEELKAWFNSNPFVIAVEEAIDRSDGKKPKRTYDRHVFVTVQPNFTATPLFDAPLCDPIKKRTFLIEGTRGVASLQIPEKVQAQGRKEAKKRKKAKPGDPIPTHDYSFLDPVAAARGWEAKLMLVGDGDGLCGFHGPLTAAAASYAAYEGTQCDREKFKAAARATIAAAPKDNDRSADNVAGYADDEYLDAALESAISKYGADGDERIQERNEQNDAETILFKRYVWVESQGKFYDCDTGDMLTERAFNMRTTELGTRFLDPANAKSNAVHFYITDKRCRRVWNQTYAPGEDPLTTDEEGRQVVNTWRPGTFTPKEGDVTMFLDLAEKLSPDQRDRDLLLNKMAWQVQNRGVKSNWGIMLLGDHGIGKDSLLAPLGLYLGPKNCATITSDDLAKSFNGFCAREMVMVQELNTRSGREVASNLKAWLAAPPHFTRIDEKHTKPYWIPNCSTWWFTTNDEDAAKLDFGDRRMCVLRSPRTQEETLKLDEGKSANEKYFARYHHWLEHEGGAEAVIYYLLRRKIPADFDARGQAPWTEAKADMTAKGHGTIARVIAEAIEDHEGPFKDDIVSTTTIADWLTSEHPASPLPRADRHAVTDHNIRKALEAAGAKRLKHQIRTGGRESQKLRLWAVRDTKLWAAMTHGELQGLYTDGTRALYGGLMA